MEKEIYRVFGGWGYRIIVNGKVFIQQDYTPCLQGKVRMSKERAERLSALVLQKLKEDPNQLPALSVEEVFS